MATRTICAQFCLWVTTVAVVGQLAGLSGERPAHGQEGARASPRTIDEVRGLVAELEAHTRNVQRSRTPDDGSQPPGGRGPCWPSLEGGQREQPAGKSQPRSNNPSLEERRRLRDQTFAEELGWKWSDERATLKARVRELPDGYKVQFDQTKEKPWALTITMTREGQTVYSREGHEYSVFVVARDVLYYRADFEPGKSGCTINAYDLKAGKVLWKTCLWGIGVGSHSQYWNRLNLRIDSQHLIVFGNEAYGQYIELLDLSTGKTVGNRLVPTPRSQ